MVNFTVEQLRKMMARKENIRNMSVIAHVDHGKSTLTDSLISKAGIIASAKSGDERFMDSRPDEKDGGITIKSTSVSLYYEREEGKGEVKEKVPYLINLIDSPGHVDFSSEVTAALRVTDGALVVVDCVESVCVQTETVLRQAIAERVRPILFLNKLDRVFLELHLAPEQCYENFRKSIESVNVVCATYTDEKMGAIEMRPQTGNVGFGSGLHAWGFTLRDFARMYVRKFGISEKKMMEKLWGNHFWDPHAKKWVVENKKKDLMRGFSQFVLHPIKTLFDSVMASEERVYNPIIKALGLKFTKKELGVASKRQKDFLKLVMRTWIPAGNALLDMFAEHLPSPIVAQKYRVDNLYSGPLDSAEAMAIRTCDTSESAPMSMYVSKMVPTTDKGRFIAFGRVFSGTIKTGQTVRILGPDFEIGKKKDLHVKKITRTVLMMGRYIEQIGDCPAGNVCGLFGVDDFLVKSGTLSTSADMHPFVTMKFSVAAVVQIAVQCKHAADLPKLVEGLKKLAKTDQLVKISLSKSGEHLIAGAGELHLDVCMRDLRNDYMKGAPVIVSEPIVSFSETVCMRTGADGKHPRTCIAKSPNKLNRMYVHAMPMQGKLVSAIESGDVQLPSGGSSGDKIKAFGLKMRTEFDWQVGEARKIWTFGCPPDALANCLVDMTRGTQYLSEAKDHLVSGFLQVADCGVLCEEVMRGIRFNLTEIKLHSDRAHRRVGQLMPCAKKSFYACQMASGPRLLEPMYLVDITVPQRAHAGVFNTLNLKRGMVEEICARPGTPLTQIKAYLPVLESFGFTELLRKKTSGAAFPQMKFSHWQLLTGDPFLSGTPANRILHHTRARKGLKKELPVFSDYFDRI